MFKMFKKTEPEKKLKKRSFVGARTTANNHFSITNAKINSELKQDFIALVLRSRSLAKNSETVASFLNSISRSVIGSGFIFHSTVQNEDGSSDKIASAQIEKNWKVFTENCQKYISVCGGMTGAEFDRLVLWTLLIDGEVFIRKVQDSNSPFGVRFQLIDSLDVDFLYNISSPDSKGNRVCMGVKVDSWGKPISYFIRKNPSLDYYHSGEREEIPASEIIHIFRKNFVGQVRGYTPLAPVLLSLNSLDSYKNAELNAALINACFMGFYEKTSAASIYENYEDDEITPAGEIASSLESNSIKFCPDGYSIKQLQNQHPNQNFGNFFKSTLKGICGTLGLSYNKISSDYESTSYSSLRASAIDNEECIKELQNFLISSWKDLQFNEFLKYLLLTDLTNLPYSRIEKFSSHTFSGKSSAYIDPVKEMAAIQLRLQLGLSNPIEEILNAGKQPEDILNGWEKWNKMLRDRNLQISVNTNILSALDDKEIENEE